MKACTMTVSGKHNFQWTYCPNFESVEKCNSYDLPENPLDKHLHYVYNHPTRIYCKMIDDTVEYFDRRPYKDQQLIRREVEQRFKERELAKSTWDKIREQKEDEETSKRMRKKDLEIAKKLNYKKK